METTKTEVLVQEISVKGLTFKCRTCGLQNSGEPIIFLHGFPESSHMWIRTMKEFAQMDYRCLAPDQRGYSPKARPKGKKKYTYKHLSSDVIALADALVLKSFILSDTTGVHPLDGQWFSCSQKE